MKDSREDWHVNRVSWNTGIANGGLQMTLPIRLIFQRSQFLAAYNCKKTCSTLREDEDTRKGGKSKEDRM